MTGHLGNMAMKQNAANDRRQHRRLELADRGQVLLRASEVTAISVADICLGGIAFSYSGREGWPEKELLLDFRDGDFCLRDVLVKVVWDREEAMPQKRQSATASIRRCGIRFVGLALEQERLLQAHLARLLSEIG